MDDKERSPEDGKGEIGLNSAWRIKKLFNKKVATILLGVAISVFSIIGFAVTCRWLGGEIVKLLDNTSKKEKFDIYILPVLMFDPVPFDDIHKADEFSLLRSAIWSAFINSGKEKYLNEDYDSFVVPSSDVDVSLSMLYGDKIKIEHQTFSDEFMNNYIYDEETKTYTVPVLDQIGVYGPKVEKINKSGEIYTLTVGYIRPNDIWQMYVSDKKRKVKPLKYMEYILKETDTGYNIIAIKDSEYKQ